jgi:hypothetical protein
MENFFQTQIGILWCCVELGCINIITDVSMLSTYLCFLREGNFDNVFRVCDYLVVRHNMRFVFDPTYPYVGMGVFIKNDKELIPSGASPPLGRKLKCA